MGGPFLNTSSSELPFLVANEHRPFDERAGWNHVGVVDLKAHRLEIVLDIAGENQLEPINLFGKEVESITPIHVPRYLLSEIRDIADRSLPVDQAGHRMALAFRGFDDRRSIMVGDVLDPKRNMVSGQDVPDGDGEGGPRKLDKGEHGTFMKEAKRNRKCPMDVSQRVLMENDIRKYGGVISVGDLNQLRIRRVLLLGQRRIKPRKLLQEVT